MPVIINKTFLALPIVLAAGLASASFYFDAKLSAMLQSRSITEHYQEESLMAIKNTQEQWNSSPIHPTPKKLPDPLPESFRRPQERIARNAKDQFRLHIKHADSNMSIVINPKCKSDDSRCLKKWQLRSLASVVSESSGEIYNSIKEHTAASESETRKVLHDEVVVSLIGCFNEQGAPRIPPLEPQQREWMWSKVFIPKTFIVDIAEGRSTLVESYTLQARRASLSAELKRYEVGKPMPIEIDEINRWTVSSRGQWIGL